MNILIIEYNNILAGRIKDSLELAGCVVVGIASDAGLAIGFVKCEKIDLIIVNIELDGIQIVKLIHKIKYIPIIFLTSFHDDTTLKEVSKINFIGCIIKSFFMQQLLRGIKLTSLSNRRQRDDEVVKLGSNYHFDMKNNLLFLNDEQIKLTKQEVTLMKLLVENLGKLVSIETVELVLWYDKIVLESTRRQLLFRLKSKIQELKVETIKGIGYKLHK